MTVSTCGIVPKILRFAREGFCESVGVLPPNDDMLTMPIAKHYLEELLAACNGMPGTSRRVTT